MNYAQQFDRLDVREQENLALLVRKKKNIIITEKISFSNFLDCLVLQSV